MKISVITINYNNKEGLTKTIRSVESQLRRDFEFVIVDGGSSDGSEEIIKNVNHKYYKYISEPDTGIYNAMNKAVNLASGEFLLHINSGDVLHDYNVMSNLIPLLDSEYDLISGYPISEYGKRDEMSSPDSLTAVHLMKNCLSHESTCIKKSLLVKFPYDENFKIASDYKFFLEAYLLGNARYKHIDLDVSICDHKGISTTQSGLLAEEKEDILKSGIVNDNILNEILLSDPKILEVLATIPKGFRIRKVLGKVDSVIVKIYKKISKR